MDFSEHNTSSAIDAGNKAIKFIVGVVAGVITAALVSLLAALVMTIDAVPDSTVGVFAYAVMALAAVVCGFVTVARIGSGGLINGLISGLIFFAVQTVAGLIFGGLSLFSAETVMHLVMDAVFAATGGIIAINIRK